MQQRQRSNTVLAAGGWLQGREADGEERASIAEVEVEKLRQASRGKMDPGNTKMHQRSLPGVVSLDNVFVDRYQKFSNTQGRVLTTSISTYRMMVR